jgi:hypothetical protein
VVDGTVDDYVRRIGKNLKGSNPCLLKIKVLYLHLFQRLRKTKIILMNIKQE